MLWIKLRRFTLSCSVLDLRCRVGGSSPVDRLILASWWVMYFVLWGCDDVTKKTWKTFLFNYEIVTCREGHNRYSRIEKYSGPNELYAQGEECQKTIGWLQLQLKYICKIFQWILCEISQYLQYIESPNYSLVKHHAKGGAPQQVGRLTHPCCAIFYRPQFFFFFLK